MILVEQRKIDYILKKARITMESVDNHFKEIDKRMLRAGIGLNMIEPGIPDDHLVEIVEIVDRKNGIVRIFEPGYPPCGACSETCILNLKFLDEV